MSDPRAETDEVIEEAKAQFDAEWSLGPVEISSGSIARWAMAREEHGGISLMEVYFLAWLQDRAGDGAG